MITAKEVADIRTEAVYNSQRPKKFIDPRWLNEDLALCKKSPLELVENLIKEAAKDGKSSYSLSRLTIEDNIYHEGDPNHYVDYGKKHHVDTWTKGHLWWKKTVKDEWDESLEVHKISETEQRIMWCLLKELHNAGYAVSYSKTIDDEDIARIYIEW